MVFTGKFRHTHCHVKLRLLVDCGSWLLSSLFVALASSRGVLVLVLVVFVVVVVVVVAGARIRGAGGKRVFLKTC